ncbi:MAG: ATP-binding protein [Aggregatilineales bacterium]
MGKEYDPEKDILFITPREHIRKRPGMYFGGSDRRALHTLISQITGIATSHAIQKNCNEFSITLADNAQVIISDNGLGMPVEVIEESQHQYFLTEYYLSNFGREKETNLYFECPYFSRSLGLIAVNAVASEFHVEIKREGYLWGQSYEQGLPQTEFRQLRPLAPDESTGSTVTFRPDFTIFEPNEFDYDYIANRMNQVAYCVPELTITVSDERSNHKHQSHTFHHPDGVAGFIQHLNRDFETLHEPIVFSKKTQISGIGLYAGKPQDVIVDVAMQYINASHPAIFSYINGEYFSERSRFELEFIKCVEQAISRPKNWVESSFERHFIKTEDMMSGLTAVISIWHPDVQFEGAIRSKLLNPEPTTLIHDGVPEALQTFRDSQPEQYQRIIAHIEAQMHTRDRRRRVEL